MSRAAGDTQRRGGGPATHRASEQPQELVLDDGRRVIVRPLRAADRELYAQAVAALSARSRYLRFGSPQPRMSERQLDLMTQADGQRHVAYIALTPDGSAVGVVRYVVVAEGGAAEVAIGIADAWQGQGLGARLMCLLVEHARAARLKTLFAVSLSENHAARRLADGSGFAPCGGSGIYANYTRAVTDAEGTREDPASDAA